MIFVMDFFIKRYVDKKYSLKDKKSVLGGKAYLEKYYNNGAMLNFMEQRPGLLKYFQTVVVAAACVCFYILLRTKKEQTLKVGMAFLLGGGLSNLFDRYTKGHVVDYIGFCFGPKWFQRIIFNVSDFFVFTGSVLAVLGYGNT